MAREIPIQHRSEQERACALERHFIDLYRDLEAAAERERARRAQAAHDASHPDRTDPLDLPPGAHVRALRVQLEKIPERQRAALLLAELHDLTGVELAAALGVSHVAARALLTRARESLRQALAAERAADAAAESRAARPMGRDR